MSLARKYRPTKFHEVVGQKPVSQALLNCLTHKEPPQAFIFAGIRGTGKTTLARLYGRALNCQNSKGFESCKKTGVCVGCPGDKDNISQTGEDLWEIDGASHNSIEDIRKLQETLLYRPRTSKKKVYIIDEVHMLSTSAFNALLKTLEEPPEFAVFLFATTELSKLPATVVSRCITFHLQRIPSSMIVERMQEILALEDISYDKQALDMVAHLSEGSMRDGLTLLTQMITLGGGKVNYSTCTTLLAYAPISDFIPLSTRVLHRDIPSALSALQSLSEKGLETKMIAENLIKIAHQLSLFLSLPPQAKERKKLDLSEQQLHEMVSQLSHHTDSKELTTNLRSFVSTIGSLFPLFTGASLDRYLLENSLLEWILSQNDKGSLSKSPSTPTVVASQPVDKKEGGFPGTWESLLAQWRDIQPIQSQELSYARLISYSPQKIELGIDQDSGSGRSLYSRQPIFLEILQKTLRLSWNFHHSSFILRQKKAISFR